MRIIRNLVFTVALLGVGYAGAGFSAEAVDSDLAESAEGFFDVSFGDLSEELELAREEGKTGVLIMFETEDCPWCHRMKLTVLNRVAVQDYFHDNFRVLSLDAEGDVLVTDFTGEEMTSKEFSLKAMRVRATPVFAFYNNEGELITRYTGALKNAHDFLLLGRYVVEGHYNSTRFNKFRRENQPG
jgi:thioredoxin-related protein